MQAGLRDRREKQIRSRQAPENLAFRARRDASDEQGGGCAIYGPHPSSGNLMQRTESKPSAGEVPVDLGYAEWQDHGLTVRRSLKVSNPVSQVLDNPRIMGA